MSAPGERRSPVTVTTPGGASHRPRASARTRYPAVSSAVSTCDPTNPDAPVRKTSPAPGAASGAFTSVQMRLGPARTETVARRPKRLTQRGGRGHDRGGLVPAVRHAVPAAFVAATAILLPLGCLEQLVVRGRISVRHQVAGTLPAEHRVAGDSPCGATEVHLALEKVEEEWRVIEPPLLALAVGERLAEDRMGALHVEPVVLVRRLLVGVARGDLHAVDLHLVVEKVEHATNRTRVVLVEERGVGGDPEAARL